MLRAGGAAGGGRLFGSAAAGRRCALRARRRACSCASSAFCSSISRRDSWSCASSSRTRPCSAASPPAATRAGARRAAASRRAARAAGGPARSAARRRPARAAAPGSVLLTDLGVGFAGAMPSTVALSGNLQLRARAQDVHVAVEGARVAAIDREHPRARRARVAAGDLAGDARQRFAATHDACRAGGRGRRRRCDATGRRRLERRLALGRLSRRRRLRRRATMAPCARLSPLTGAATGAVRRRAGPGVYTGGSSSTVYSRTSLPRAQFTSSEQREERLGDRPRAERSLMTSRPSALCCGLHRDAAQGTPG